MAIYLRLLTDKSLEGTQYHHVTITHMHQWCNKSTKHKQLITESSMTNAMYRQPTVISRLQQRPTSANDRRPKSSQLVKLECIDDSTMFSYFKIRI